MRVHNDRKMSSPQNIPYKHSPHCRVGDLSRFIVLTLSINSLSVSQITNIDDLEY